MQKLMYSNDKSDLKIINSLLSIGWKVKSITPLPNNPTEVYLLEKVDNAVTPLDNIDYIEKLQKEFSNAGKEGRVLRNFIDFLHKNKKLIDLRSKSQSVVENPKEYPIEVYVRGGVAYCYDERVQIIDYDNKDEG